MRTRIRASVAVLLLFLTLPFLAQPVFAAPLSSDPAGHWEGAIEIPGSPLAVDVDLAAEGGGWKGDISIPAQKAKDLPLAAFVVDGTGVQFEIDGVPGKPTFHGNLSEDGGKIAGDFLQGGGKFHFTLARAAKAEDTAKADLADLRPLVETMLEAWKVPGLALAVVKGGKVVYAEGFGYRDLEAKTPVSPDTLFAIGSSTKAFTTFLLGTLVDEGKLDWDKPVRTYMPGFAMYDPKSSETMTPRDLVTHRSGLPRHDALWYNNKTMSRAELVARLRYLEPNETLRAKWQYNNLMFLTAGVLAEQITGQPWEEGVRSRIFAPLGMKRSNFSVADSQKDSDFAYPYDEREEKIVKIPFRDITTIGPAGSINSSVREMAEWVKLHLSDGKASDGKRLIEPGTLADLHAPAMVMGNVPERVELSTASYALGWMVDAYRGHLRVEHGGNIDGFSALVTLLPNDDAGMVVLTNLNGTGVPERLVRHTIDRLLHLSPIDWNGEALAKRDVAKTANDEAKKKKDSVRVPGTKPAHKLADYAGDYEHPGYGRLKVELAGDHLEATYNDIRTPLEHWHYEVWNGTGKGTDPALEDTKLLFEGDLRGNVAAVAVQLEPQVADIVFTKVPEARLSDPAYLQRLVGDYELPGQVIKIALAGSTLVARIAGQPEYHLVPALGGEFVLKEAKIVSLRFVEDAKGVVTSITLNQPQGVFTANRKK